MAVISQPGRAERWLETQSSSRSCRDRRVADSLRVAPSKESVPDAGLRTVLDDVEVVERGRAVGEAHHFRGRCGQARAIRYRKALFWRYLPSGWRLSAKAVASALRVDGSPACSMASRAGPEES